METNSHFTRALNLAHHHALEHLQAGPLAAVNATASVADLRARLAKPLGDDGLAPEQVIADLVRDTAGGFVGNTSGRFYGWVMGGTLPAALAADWLVSAWDQNAALYACAPAAAIVEEVAGAWLKDLFGLTMECSYAFVTGCQMAHVTCLAAARQALLRDQGYDVERRGLQGAPRIRILANSHRHGSIERAVRMLGLGSDNIVDLPTDESGRIDVDGFESALCADSSGPALVVLQAGDINTGACDDFAKLIPVARRHGAWVHVDGAFGLWAAASPDFRHVLRGVEAADSWTADGHKWLNLPFDCGYAFVRDAAAHRASMSHRASYLVHADDARDQIDWNPEWSRRARGFPTYAALRQLGRSGIAALIDNCCAQARALVEGLASLPGVEILCEPLINQALVRFRDPRVDASADDHDRRTDAVIEAVNTTGEAFFTGSTWRGRRVMRISVCNWQTDADDIRRAISAMAKLLNDGSAQ